MLWTLICTLVGYVLKFCYFLTKNYGVALLLFALFFKLLLLPSGIKQQKMQVARARLHPKEMAIRKKYQNIDPSDRVMAQRVQMEIQEMYQREGVSAMGGCLPLLLQMPIIFALYSVIRSPLTFLLGWNYEEKTHHVLLRAMNLFNEGKPFGTELQAIGVIQKNIGDFTDLIHPSELPNFSFLSLDLTWAPGFHFDRYIFIPLLTFVVMYGTMELSRRLTTHQNAQNADAMKGMAIMNIVMPLMSTWIATTVPSALGIYWMYQSLYGAIQQFVLTKAFPLPQLTEEDYAQAERELRGKSGKRKNRANTANLDPNRVRPRSLHRIDEYEPMPPAQPKKPAQLQEAEAAAQTNPDRIGESKEAIAAAPHPNMLEGVALKEATKEEKKPKPKKKKKSAETAETEKPADEAKAPEAAVPNAPAEASDEKAAEKPAKAPTEPTAQEQPTESTSTPESTPTEESK